MIGCRPRIRDYVFAGDWQLVRALVFGPQASYQYRLTGPHKWAGVFANENILIRLSPF
jgi:hypothetical protein